MAERLRWFGKVHLSTGEGARHGKRIGCRVPYCPALVQYSTGRNPSKVPVQKSAGAPGVGVGAQCPGGACRLATLSQTLLRSRQSTVDRSNSYSPECMLYLCRMHPYSVSQHTDHLISRAHKGNGRDRRDRRVLQGL